MKSSQIIAKKFCNLKRFAKKNKKKYLISKPFPHIVLDNFFNIKYLNEILDNFPDLSKLNETQKYSNKNEIKLANSNIKNYPKKIKNFINFLNSKEFVKFLQEMTSIK